jgi:hypothetical protein
LIAVAAIAAAVAGCGGGSSPSAAPPAPATRAAANTSVYTAAQLRSALLLTINGAKPAVPVEWGAYGSLPGVKATKSSLAHVKIIPARCASATGTGLSSPQFAKVPATVATFRVGRVGLSEVLLAPPSSLLAVALTSKFPAGCMRYHARVGNRTFTYQITVVKAPHLGDAARELNVRAFAGAGRAHRAQSEDIWTIIYRTHGLVGAITLVGQQASRSVAESIARQAYARAQKTLV